MELGHIHVQHVTPLNRHNKCVCYDIFISCTQIVDICWAKFHPSIWDIDQYDNILDTLNFGLASLLASVSRFFSFSSYTFHFRMGSFVPFYHKYGLENEWRFHQISFYSILYFICCNRTYLNTYNELLAHFHCHLIQNVRFWTEKKCFLG